MNTIFLPFVTYGVVCSILILASIQFVEACGITFVGRNLTVCQEAINSLIGGGMVGVIMTCIALSVHAQLPSIFIRDTGFRIQCFIYTSPWLSWEAIEKIKTPYPFAPIKIYAIQVTGLSLLFLLIGITQRLSGRGFLLSDRIERFDRLKAILVEKRPDLFT